MIEPELAFADLEDDMACATAYLQYVVGYLANLLSIYGFIDILSLMLCVSNIDLISNFAWKVKYILENCKEDMDFFNTWIEKGIVDRLSVWILS